MLLETLEALNFRNLRGEMSFSGGINIIHGENGQGKTNWLEAIYLLANASSFRASKLQETISFGSDTAYLKGTVRQSAEIERVLQITLQGKTKQLLVNGKKEAAPRYLSNLHAVIFNADELEIVRGAPEARRRFLDQEITGVFPAYAQTLSDYARVIKQKNALLQKAGEEAFSWEKTAEALAPWNEQLIALAAKIHKARVRFVERLSGSLETRLFQREELSIRYVSSLEGKGDLEDYAGLLSERLALRVQAELAAGYALVGPHRDDLEILFDGHELRAYGSSGQQRSALLVLLLAGISVYHAQLGEYPLFLLDDLDAELDYRRIGQLLEYLDGKTQTFATTSKESFVERFNSLGIILHVEDGGILRQKRSG
jgi:DNA replication and repair protein RecF